MITRKGDVHLIKHPYIKSLYLEKNGTAPHSQNVLVIETDIDIRTAPCDGNNHEFIEFLTDLTELQMMAEHKIGNFVRIDIRCPGTIA